MQGKGKGVVVVQVPRQTRQIPSKRPIKDPRRMNIAKMKQRSLRQLFILIHFCFFLFWKKVRKEAQPSPNC
ncbi:hypothetical protein BO86DRAFT_237156 [Aspergillus japonicus CBS 114.51]|uniref:Uncharacterized protein n=1 Tax=Aspergillus japonicus CBS 114.51 TaxID=1448312 RepID=A0A8T8WMD8_ASPJA|nr:hypothetical protein BO86DRAFT_237156 [Aspergillus japonicus CBS 114.51]RAH76873.1 hypothetical protein BO86DRAFT_237156 [Aspergillus japonicus CBS 114.51]